MTDPLIGRVLGGRYRIERKLGQGGMGAVYAAVHLELARPVAVKTLLEVVDRRDFERLRTEAVAAASLAHPHIVSVTDFAGPKGDEPAFLVMELLAGHALSHVIARRGALASETAVHIALQILDALAKAHEARILHRDIKPANVIVLDGADATRPWIKVVDFGIAKIMDDGSRHTTTGTLLGTPAYMAPEQLLAQPATERTDVYAVGVCLFEMLAGSRPFIGRGGELVSDVLEGQPPALPVEPRLAAIVQRAMHRDARERFASARELADALRGLAEPGAQPVAKKTPWARFAGAIAGTLAIVGVVVFVVSKRPPPPRPAPVAIAPADADVSVAPIDSTPPPPNAAVDASADAASPVARASMVFAACVDAGNRILCPKVMWMCECKDGEVLVHDSPDHSRGRFSFQVSDGKTRNGTECRGWAYAWDPAYSPTPAVGRFRCMTYCDTSLRLAGRRMAVPGTRCVGFLDGEAPIEGTWKPVPRDR